MSNADITDLNDECLLEILERMSLLGQVCAGNVCRRWRAMCQRYYRRVYKLSGDGYTWRFKKQDGTILHATSDREAVKSVLKSCSMFIESFKLDILHRPRDLRDLRFIVGITVSRCGNLRAINVRKINDLTLQIYVRLMINQNRNLLSLIMQDVGALSAYNLAGFLPARINEFRFFDDEPTEELALTELLKACPNLKSFSCNYVPGVVVELLGSLHDLRYLCVKYAFAPAQSFNRLAYLRHLITLDLEKSTIEDENLFNIAQYCRQLACLRITTCDKITDIGILCLASLEKLTDLDMKGMNKVTDASIALLPVSLRILCCCECEGVFDAGVIRFLARAKNLEKLCIKNTQITNITIEAAMRIVGDKSSKRNLEIYVAKCKADIDTIKKTVIKDSPSLLQIYHF